jgi:CheY-like chemotaxis protein
MDGYEVAQKIRQAGLTKAKIIALTGFRPDEARCKEVGIDHHLMKPVTLQTLLDVLHCTE